MCDALDSRVQIHIWMTWPCALCSRILLHVDANAPQSNAVQCKCIAIQHAMQRWVLLLVMRWVLLLVMLPALVSLMSCGVLVHAVGRAIVVLLLVLVVRLSTQCKAMFMSCIATQCKAVCS